MVKEGNIQNKNSSKIDKDMEITVSKKLIGNFLLVLKKIL